MAKKETVWKQLYRHLKSKGYDVYGPDQKEGYCNKPYVVLKTGVTIGLEEISSSERMYDLLVYVPKDKFSEVEEYTDKLKEDMDEMFPLVRTTGSETEPFYDDSVRAYMTSVQYVNYRKRKRR